jgi:hypothetical protein
MLPNRRILKPITTPNKTTISGITHRIKIKTPQDIWWIKWKNGAQAIFENCQTNHFATVRLSKTCENIEINSKSILYANFIVDVIDCINRPHQVYCVSNSERFN